MSFYRCLSDAWHARFCVLSRLIRDASTRNQPPAGEVAHLLSLPLAAPDASVAPNDGGRVADRRSDTPFRNNESSLPSPLRGAGLSARVGHGQAEAAAPNRRSLTHIAAIAPGIGGVPRAAQRDIGLSNSRSGCKQAEESENCKSLHGKFCHGWSPWVYVG